MYFLMVMLLALPARRCSEGARCTEGICGCPDSRPDLCGSVCVDMMSWTDNCGACGNRYGNELLPVICIPTESFDVHPYYGFRDIAPEIGNTQCLCRP
jgi:hypothetical protein